MHARTRQSLPASVALWVALASSASAGEVLFDGCEEVRDGPVCVLPADGSLRVWVDGIGAGDIAFEYGGMRLPPPTMTARAGGHLFELRVPAQAGALAVVKDGEDNSVLTLALDAPQPRERAAEANALMAAGDYDAALQYIAVALTDAPAHERAPLLRARGRVLGRQGDVAGSQRALRAAIDAAQAGGQVYTALQAAGALAFSLARERKLYAARDVLARFDAKGLGHAPSRYFRSHYLALVAFNGGDTRTQLALFADAAETALRFDWPRRQLNSESLLAVQWQRLGRRASARALLDGWRERLPAELGDCERALYWTNVGWSYLLALEAREEVADPTPVLQRAAREVTASCGVTEQLNAQVNLALAHWHAGRVDAASASLARSRSLSDAPALHVVFWARDIEARVALSLGNANDALALYDDLARLARATGSPATRWRAIVGRARALEALNDVPAALAAYADAQRELDADLLRVPLTDGRETLIATRRDATQRQLALLLDAQRTDEAFALARHQRARVVRNAHVAARIAKLGTEARQRWDGAIGDYQALRASLSSERAQSWALPADALRDLELRAARKERALRAILDAAVAALPDAPPATAAPRLADGELYLALARTSDGWAVFDYDEQTLNATRVGCDDEDPARIAACALAPLAARIARADGVVIAPPAALRGVDFHALVVDEEMMIDRVRVSYAADLGGADAPIPRAGAALLVADPHGNLREARREVRDTRSRLTASGRWLARTIVGEDAQATRIREALAGADLFHYAGHADFRAQGGWDSALLLANETRLGIGDILTLSKVPALVLLSGCETAHAAGVTTPGFSLAGAFIASGSAAVIATSRTVDDASAYAMTQAFYDQFARGQPLTHAFHNAQLEVRAQQPQRDWSAFRLLQP